MDGWVWMDGCGWMGRGWLGGFACALACKSVSVCACDCALTRKCIFAFACVRARARSCACAHTLICVHVRASAHAHARVSSFCPIFSCAGRRPFPIQPPPPPPSRPLRRRPSRRASELAWVQGPIPAKWNRSAGYRSAALPRLVRPRGRVLLTDRTVSESLSRIGPIRLLL